MVSRLVRSGVWVLLSQLALALAVASAAESSDRPPENLYRGELVGYPGPWSFLIGRSSIILVTDDELEALSDPDRPVNLSLGTQPWEVTLRQLCERAQAVGQRTLIVAFDHFFAQYRPGQEGKPRRLTPDKDEYVERIASISKFAQQYGLGLELSLLSPLEIGPGCARETGETGVWMHYRKGLRDPGTGQYSVQLWQQRRWTNNKGPIDIKDAGVRVFAFREARLHGTPYIAVKPEEIVEITDTAKAEVWEHASERTNDYHAVRIRIHGSGGKTPEGYDRVLVVQVYHTPEMDYFSERALPYLNGLTDRYLAAGVKLNALYADEMHIQQDWRYHNHHDHGEFALRYVSPGLAKRFAALHGRQYEDFAKYLVYFVHGQEDCAHDLSAKGDVIHVFGPTPEDVRRTALFRSRYYKLLQDGVVDLFTAAKHHLERRVGYRIESRAHATWAESPTCDRWDPNGSHGYEYTPSFLWSNTVHQAASACHDYFKWGDFLTGNGNDHTEGGWLDRNYLGLALACSTGILNEVPYSYGAHWGMPEEVSRRRQALVDTYGAAANPIYGMVQDMQHRDVEVLMLYPLDLVAVDERFGSWVSQYGYANLITQAKLLERGQVRNGAIEVAGRRFTTLAALFEPFPSRELLTMMSQLVEQGGRVIWSGPPPVVLSDGTPALPIWQELTGVHYAPRHSEGLAMPGRQVNFEGILSQAAPMTILTDMLVDHVYPIAPQEKTQVVARVGAHVVGSIRRLPGGGSATVLGFRPRDDQSASLGYESRHWFDILCALGAYPPTGRIPDVNDNTEHLSRTTGYLACRFPNGAVAIAPHLHRLEECWPGGFARDRKQDEALLKDLALPSERVSLKGFKVNGHVVDYEGDHAVVFRVNPEGEMIGFCGLQCREITVDGRSTVFADQPMAVVAWAPVEPVRRVPGGAVMQLYVAGAGTVRIPAAGLSGEFEVVGQGPKPGSRGPAVPSRLEGGRIVIEFKQGTPQGWLYVVPRAGAQDGSAGP